MCRITGLQHQLGSVIFLPFAEMGIIVVPCNAWSLWPQKGSFKISSKWQEVSVIYQPSTAGDSNRLNTTSSNSLWWSLLVLVFWPSRDAFPLPCKRNRLLDYNMWVVFARIRYIYRTTVLMSLQLVLSTWSLQIKQKYGRTSSWNLPMPPWMREACQHEVYKRRSTSDNGSRCVHCQ